MRIILDLQGCQTESRFRGIGRYSVLLAKALIRNAAEHTIYIVLNGNFPESVELIREDFDKLLPAEQIITFCVPDQLAESKAINLPRARAAELVREQFLANLKPDVVYTLSLFEEFYSDAVTSIGRISSGYVNVVTVYDLIPLENPYESLPSNEQKEWYFNKIKSLKRADYLLSISEFSKKQAVALLSVEEKKVVNISIDTDVIFERKEIDSASQLLIQSRLGITQPFILYTGGFDSRKNIKGLIKAYTKMPDNERTLTQLVIVGRAPAGDSSSWVQFAKECGLCNGEVIFTGYLSDKDLVQLYNLCRVFVYPSFSEGFGLPILEAMKCGAVVIGANRTSIPEVIGLDEALFEPDDEDSIINKILKALTDEKFRDRLRENALKQSEKYSWDVSAQRVLQLFEQAQYSRAHEKNESSLLTYFDKEQRLDELLRSIATISGLTEKDQFALSKSIAQNEFEERPKRMFIDISELVQRDTKTGIQRVVRSILSSLLANPPQGFTVEPVYESNCNYYYAREYARVTFGVPYSDTSTELIDYQIGDIFLGLDLWAVRVPILVDTYKKMKNYGVEVHFVVYDLLPVLCPEFFWEPLPEVFQHWLSAISEVSSGIVCISRAVADDYLSWLIRNPSQRIRHLKVGYFHLGADIDNSVPSKGLPENAQQILEELARFPTFLVVGTLEPRKGHLQTLEAFERLWAAGLDVNLVLVGKLGWKMEKLAARVREHSQLNKRLYWLEGISDEYLEELYAVSTCLLAPSEGEGFGLPLIEAAQHNLKILARNIPVFREVAGEHAYYFDGKAANELADAIASWLDADKMGNAPEVAGMRWLTWSDSAEQLMEVLLQGKWYQKWSIRKQGD